MAKSQLATASEAAKKAAPTEDVKRPPESAMVDTVVETRTTKVPPQKTVARAGGAEARVKLALSATKGVMVLPQSDPQRGTRELAHFMFGLTGGLLGPFVGAVILAATAGIIPAASVMAGILVFWAMLISKGTRWIDRVFDTQFPVRTEGRETLAVTGLVMGIQLAPVIWMLALV